jgi:hypothetical protein
MILPSTTTTVAVGIALLAGTEALPEPAAVRRQEISSSGKWSCGAGRRNVVSFRNDGLRAMQCGYMLMIQSSPLSLLLRK